MEATAYTSNNRKERGREEEEEGVAAGDPIKFFDKHCSTQGRKNMNTDDIISQGVLCRGCCAACCVTLIKMFTAMLESIIKEFASHIST